jgi:hypothetical protein
MGRSECLACSVFKDHGIDVGGDLDIRRASATEPDYVSILKKGRSSPVFVCTVCALKIEM